MRHWILLASMLAGSACTDSGFPKMIVRNQASYDFDCDAEQIKVAPIGNHRYTAEGCFKREVYICSHGMFLPDEEIQCSQQVNPLPAFEDPKHADDESAES